MLKKFLIHLCFFMSVFTVSGLVYRQAYADLVITPFQVLFDGRDRYADVTLINSSDEWQNYEMKWAYNKQLPVTGAYESLESLDEGEFDLSKYVVFSPKRVSLGPHEKQKVRLALRRPEHVEPGDYHVHLMFSALGTPPKDEKDVEDGKLNIGVSIVINYAIPVIFRVGEDDVKAEIGEISIERNPTTGKLKAIVPIKRSPESNYSILGHLQLYHIDESGEEEFVGEIVNSNIFTEISERNLEVILTKDITGGTLRVVLKSWIKDDDRIYAVRDFSLE